MLRARPSGAHGHFQQNRLIAFGQGHENPVSALFRNAIAAGVQFAHGGDFAERHEYARLLPFASPYGEKDRFSPFQQGRILV